MIFLAVIFVLDFTYGYQALAFELSTISDARRTG